MKESERKKRIRAKDDVLSEDDISKMVKHAEGDLRTEFIVKAILWGGMRAGEIAHFKESWYVPNKNIISLPVEQPCACRECRIREFSTKMRKEWKKDFPKISFTVKRLEEQVRTNDKYKKEFLKITTGFWEPKTNAGIREIPIVYDEFKDVIVRFLNIYGEVGLTRSRVWQIVGDVALECGVKTEERDVYPHCIRATCASLWGMKGVSPATMCKMFGWDNISSANPYITIDKERAKQEMTEHAGDSLW